MPAIIDALSEAEMDHMLLLEWRQLVGLFMCVIVRNSIKGMITSGHCTAVKTGLAGLHGNKVLSLFLSEVVFVFVFADTKLVVKGAIAIRLLVQDTSICLINAHLPAHHSQVNERNTDAGLILKEELFPPKHEDFGFGPFSFSFFSPSPIQRCVCRSHLVCERWRRSPCLGP